jgi:hypothetical protein
MTQAQRITNWESAFILQDHHCWQGRCTWPKCYGLNNTTCCRCLQQMHSRRIGVSKNPCGFGLNEEHQTVPSRGGSWDDAHANISTRPNGMTRQSQSHVLLKWQVKTIPTGYIFTSEILPFRGISPDYAAKWGRFSEDKMCTTIQIPRWRMRTWR